MGGVQPCFLFQYSTEEKRIYVMYAAFRKGFQKKNGGVKKLQLVFPLGEGCLIEDILTLKCPQFFIFIEEQVRELSCGTNKGTDKTECTNILDDIEPCMDEQ